MYKRKVYVPAALAAAEQQEHTLRMRILSLMHVADPGGVPPIVADEDALRMAGRDTSSNSGSCDDGAADSAERSPSSPATAAAAAGAGADDSGSGTSRQRGGRATYHTRADGRRRRRCQPRQSLRSEEEIALLLQLPASRYVQ